MCLPAEYSPPKLVHTECHEAAQVCLADAPNRVDVGTGAVILGHVAPQAEQWPHIYKLTRTYSHVVIYIICSSRLT